MLAAILGVAAALAAASRSGAEGPSTPCQANPDATTITQKTYIGSNGPETIQADEKANVIYGRDGADTICSYRGRDHVYGGRGKDDLWGEYQNEARAVPRASALSASG